MADAIEIYLDVSTPQGALVKGLNDKSTLVLGPFYQGALLNLRVFPVTPTANVLSPPFFSQLSISSLDLQVAVGPRAGAEAIKAAQYTWSKQLVPDSEGKSGYFYASLNLNTNDLNTAISTSDTYTTYIEFILSRSGAAFTPVCQSAITINAVVKDPGSAASIPTPTASYLTADQCYNAFVTWDNRLRSANYGRVPIFVSPDGSHTREAPGVDNNGMPVDNLT